MGEKEWQGLWEKKSEKKNAESFGYKSIRMNKCWKLVLGVVVVVDDDVDDNGDDNDNVPILCE